MSFGFGDLFDALDERLPADAPALTHVRGGESFHRGWGDLKRRTNNLGRALRDNGAADFDKVCFLMRNRSEYVEALVACFKARLAHVNVNYRYVDRELHYIIDNSDGVAVLYAAEFRDRVDAIRAELPKVKLWVELDGDPPGRGSVDYEMLAEGGDGTALGLERSPQDQLFLYTGGTTGMPKGVIWEHAGLWESSRIALAQEEMDDVGEIASAAAATPQRQRQLPACPLMHGTGLFTAMNTMLQGGSVVTLEGHHLDPVALWDTVDREGVSAMAIVGDAFAKPMLDALDGDPERWTLHSLVHIVSSGVMWSPEVKAGLMRHKSALVLLDTFGASEGIGVGGSTSTGGDAEKVAHFTLSDRAKVFSEDLREIKPGSDEIGYVAVRGSIPLGYYKDPEKTAKVFKMIDGVRWSMPGDFCRVEADGKLVLLGRGSVCINSAGEKIFPEEVEEALKTHDSVVDALVVGLPSEKWGQQVTAVVQLAPDAELDEGALVDHCREHLAGYKLPKRIFARDTLSRAANGKANYKLITKYATERQAAAG